MTSRTTVIVTAALLVALAGVPSGMATSATAPAASGTYTTIEWSTYHVGTEADAKVRIDKLASENNPTYNWYNVVNYLRQTDANSWFDYHNFWTYVGQPGSYIPDEVDWSPGIYDTGSSVVNFDIGVAGGSPSYSAGVSWDQDWNGDWRIASRGTDESSAGTWKYFYHQESFECCAEEGGGRNDNWDYMAHGTSWKVKSADPTAFYVRAAVKYCESNWSCYGHMGPNQWQDSGLKEAATDGPDSCATIGALELIDNLLQAAAICIDSMALVTPPVPSLDLPFKDGLNQKCPEIWVVDCNPSTADYAGYILDQEIEF